MIVVKGVRSRLAEGGSASVAQFDLQELSALGAQSIGDLARVTPNLEIKSAHRHHAHVLHPRSRAQRFQRECRGRRGHLLATACRSTRPPSSSAQLFDIESVETSCAARRGSTTTATHRRARSGPTPASRPDNTRRRCARTRETRSQLTRRTSRACSRFRSSRIGSRRVARSVVTRAGPVLQEPLRKRRSIREPARPNQMGLQREEGQSSRHEEQHNLIPPGLAPSRQRPAPLGGAWRCCVCSRPSPRWTGC